MSFIIVFVLGPFKFPVTLNSFTGFSSYTNFIFATVSYCSSSSSSSCFCSLAAADSTSVSSCYCPLASSSASFSTMSFDLSCPYPIFSIILLYNKEAILFSPAVFLQVHLMLLPQVLIQRCITLKLYFSKMNSSFINIFLRNFLKILWTEKMTGENFP